ncbi:hypothetical protein GCM10025864_15190 [Luteimicrobium album]|uniref:HTH tetR-type domain-containing protein n=1 Tax=Luteimicrobium album TaxID=1054550 RepID=A0ABQ6I1V2_9MICO|nr:ScbR family autoregulator-binding transcription factor [Luteimicrobium album]GMA23760.1 hypothetical protein GCM10025864_15190 [Luteimicrobium album]
MEGREPQQDRGYARRESILIGAATMFEELGYGQTSLKQIATAAGATMGSVYFYFPTKEALALSVIEEQYQRTFDVMASVGDGCAGIEVLVRTSEAIASLMLRDVVVQAGIRLSIEQGSQWPATRGFYRGWMDGLVPALQQAQDMNELDSSLTLQEIADILVPFFTGVHMISKVLTDRDDLYPSLQRMWHVMIDAITAPDQRPHLRALVAELFGVQPSGRAR